MKKLILFFVVLQLSLFASDSVDIESNVLHEAVRHDDIESLIFLIAQDIDLDETDKDGNTALHLAVKANNLSMVKLLLDNYVDTNTKNSFGETPIISAARNSDMKIAKELVCSGASYNDKDTNDISALQYSIQNNNIELAKLLTLKPNDQGCKIELSIDNIKKNEVCGRILRGEAQKVVFFILDTDNTALIESSKARLFDNGKKWCAKSNSLGLISGNYEIVANGFGKNKKGIASKTFEEN